MKELDKNKEYITSNLSGERRKALLEYLKEEDEEWEVLGIDELLDCVLKCRKDGWHAFYEKLASQDAIDANTLFQEIKLNKEFSYYLGDLSAEQLEEVRLEVIKENHAAVFYSPYMVNDVDYLEWMTHDSGIWTRRDIPGNEVINALALFDISDKNSENDLNNEQLPEKWCLKITEENKDKVRQWIESHEDYASTGQIRGFAVSDAWYDNSYQVYSDTKPTGYELITNEQFIQFVYPECLKSVTELHSDHYPFKPNTEELGEMYDFLQSGTQLVEEKQVFPISVFTATRAVELCNLLNNVQRRNTQLVEEASFGGGEKTEKRQFFFHNSKKHGPNFYTKEEVQYHNGEEWSEDLILYTQLGSNKKFVTTKERFKKFKEVWV